MLNKISNKNVLIFDLETTGIPLCRPSAKGKNKYYPFNENTKYDSSRIISIAWTLIEDFTIDKLSNDNTKYFIRKPVNFKVSGEEFHNITHDIALKEGITFIDILNKEGLKDDLLKTDIIIAHNCLFDFNILMNELFRIKSMQLLVKLTEMYDKNEFICTGEYSKNICKISFGNTTNNFSYKMPKLNELYKFYYNEDYENQHNAKYDLLALVNVVKKLC